MSLVTVYRFEVLGEMTGEWVLSTRVATRASIEKPSKDEYWSILCSASRRPTLRSVRQHTFGLVGPSALLSIPLRSEREACGPISPP
jgi:hypothetical protein